MVRYAVYFDQVNQTRIEVTTKEDNPALAIKKAKAIWMEENANPHGTYIEKVKG